jgi:hypothetical protein
MCGERRRAIVSSVASRTKSRTGNWPDIASGGDIRINILTICDEILLPSDTAVLVLMNPWWSVWFSL